MRYFYPLAIFASLLLNSVDGWALPSSADQSTEARQAQEHFRQQVQQAAKRIEVQQTKSQIMKAELKDLEKASAKDRAQTEKKLTSLKNSLAAIAEEQSKAQQAFTDLQKNIEVILDANEKVAPLLHQEIQESEEALQPKGAEFSDQERAIANLQAAAKAKDLEAAELRASIAADQSAIDTMLTKQKAFVNEMTKGKATKSQ